MPNIPQEYVRNVQECRLRHSSDAESATFGDANMLRGNVCGISDEAHIACIMKMQRKKATSKGIAVN